MLNDRIMVPVYVLVIFAFVFGILGYVGYHMGYVVVNAESTIKECLEQNIELRERCDMYCQGNIGGYMPLFDINMSNG